ncbi:MAG: putative transport system ATP-binding protein, partial [Actinomycetota bacterium]|nr:putative transport system ATP-binding protein [Actinomycetota bacterium]
MQHEAAASCIGLVKSYWTETGVVRALEGIDATFPSGSVTAVVGPSGSGKSSLLRLLAGMDRPTAGDVTVAGLSLGAISSRKLRKIRHGMVGYVFQRPSDNFISYLTVAEHLRLASGRVPSATGPDPTDLLAALGIEQRADHLPHELSGGEQQRAAFAQVLMTAPGLVVADEPTAELDGQSGEDLLKVVSEIAGTGVGFIIATHDAKVARRADRTIEIDHGHLKTTPHSTTRPAVAPQRVREAERAATSLFGRRKRPYEATSDRAFKRPAPPLPSIDVSTPLLDLTNISKTYTRGSEKVHAVDDVSLQLTTGRVLGLMGRSGSGKTTLLSIVAGWETPDTGTISWFDRDGTPQPTAAQGRLPWKQVAVVPQKLGLIEELTVRKNIEYPARLDGSLEEHRDRVNELIEQFGLEDLAERVPAETSVGQQQRVALARALVMSPRLLLADEPSGHQDARWVNDVFKAMKAAADGGTCCLIATHNEEVAGFFDTIYSMSEGRLT